VDRCGSRGGSGGFDSPHEGEAIRTTLSKDIASLYLRGLQGRWGLKPFNGITTAPILNDDGSFRVGSGYDETTGLWCHQIPGGQRPRTAYQSAG
jgi:hypothetical protein